MKPRDNPFRSRCIDAIEYRPQGISWSDLLRRVNVLRFRAAIVGPHGTGKTTLMERLHHHYLQQDFSLAHVRLASSDLRFDWSEVRRLTESPCQRLLLLDGADLLPRWTWWQLARFTRRCDIGLLVTSHRSGMLPTLLQTRTNCELLREIVLDLAGGEITEVEKIYDETGGNLRQAFRKLYHHVALD